MNQMWHFRQSAQYLEPHEDKISNRGLPVLYLVQCHFSPFLIHLVVWDTELFKAVNSLVTKMFIYFYTKIVTFSTFKCFHYLLASQAQLNIWLIVEKRPLYRLHHVMTLREEEWVWLHKVSVSVNGYADGMPGSEWVIKRDLEVLWAISVPNCTIPTSFQMLYFNNETESYNLRVIGCLRHLLTLFFKINMIKQISYPVSILVQGHITWDWPFLRRTNTAIF